MTAPLPLPPSAANLPTPPGAAELRRRAERQLRRPDARSGPARIEADAQRLVHELEVHQVELELQNTELKEARDRTEQLLARYTDLYEFAPAGYFSLTPSGHIRLVNLVGAGLLGVERARLLGQPFGRHVEPEQQPVFRAFLQRAFAGDARQSCVVTLRGTGPAREVSVEAERSADRQECLAVVEDITEQRQAEALLRRNEALFSALIEQAPIGIYLVDDQLRLQQVNPRARPFFSRILPLLGEDFQDVIRRIWPRKTADNVVAHVRHTLATGEPYTATDFSERRRDTGATQAYEWQLQRVTLPSGQQRVVCFFNDITDRKRAAAVQRRVELLAVANEMARRDIARRRVVEASLRRSEKTQRRLLAESRMLHARLRGLARQIITAQEAERKEISRELHDDVMQTLVGINVELSALAKDASLGVRALRAKIVRTQRLVTHSVGAVHRFARDLRPAVLDDLGLIPALQTHCESVTARKHFKIRLTASPGIENLPVAKRIVLFRVAQEALTNVARHARASRVTVRLSEPPGLARMEIHDNGQSFHVEKTLEAKNNRRLGLIGMKERLEMVGGTLTIRSAPGCGTTVRADLPFQPGKAPA